ncbi:MAG TPA: patatin-like phospholipase family protein [Pseudonocardiaceae bacterium]|nr:patatin-like phospholipase family protein [Pseudonocardiaceae bacterium]
MAGDAFVFGGGGLLGAAEAGMARALLEAGIVPELICGTSIGAINGAALAAEPTADAAATLVSTWERLVDADVFGTSMVGRVVELVRSGTALHGNDSLRALLADRLPASEFGELAVPFECVAASIESAREHWFTTGDLVSAVLASCALPGVFPPVAVGNEHYFDGGLVNSIPLERAVRQGARRIWVLHVGRIEERLSVPRRPWEVGFVAFEIARRHRFNTDLGRVPSDVEVHVLPTGLPQRQATTWSNLRYRDARRISSRADTAYLATKQYLAERLPQPDRS